MQVFAPDASLSHTPYVFQNDIQDIALQAPTIHDLLSPLP